MKNKKIIWALVCAVALLVVGGVCSCLFSAYDPGIVILRSNPITQDKAGVSYKETIGMAVIRNSPIPLAESAKEDVEKFWRWNDKVTSELVELCVTEPYDIRVSGERKGREITLRYQGFVTTNEGETVDFLREATFHLFVRGKDFRL